MMIQTVTQASPHTSARREAMLAFVRQHVGEGAQVVPLAGDASFRRYERVTGADGRVLVLMDAPPEKEDTAPFIMIGDYLVAQGFSAPKIIARDTAQGFLLLEDLGDVSYTKKLATEPSEELALYTVAIDVLAALHRQNRADGVSIPVPHYDLPLLMREVKLFSEWFLPAVMGGRTAAVARAAEWEKLWDMLLRQRPLEENVLVLRDYHADNLMWLPSRKGTSRCGLLDFQDGVVGHAAYDLVSLLEDARRDVAPATVEAMLTHYVQLAGVSADDFRAAYALLGAQRNAKIIGIFSRLGVRDGKKHYTRYLPRVWRHFEHDLQHPWLAEVKAWVETHIPQEWRGEITLPDSLAE